MICYEYCQLAVTSPILDYEGNLYVIQLSISLADTLLDFQRITGADIGVLTPINENSEASFQLGKTGLAFSSLTNRALLQPMIHHFALEKRWRRNFIGNGEQLVNILDLPSAQYELMFVSNPELTGINAFIVFVSNTTQVREQIEFARHTHIIIGLLATFVSLVLVVIVLWRPIRSLQRQARALPLLPQGKYAEAKERLEKIATKKSLLTRLVSYKLHLLR